MNSLVTDRPGGVLVFRSIFLGISETFIRDHVQSLRRWRPIVVYKAPSGEAPRTIGVPAYRVYPPRFRAIAERVIERGGFNPRISQVVRRHDVRLAHAHFLHDGARMAAYCLRHRLPLVVTAHGYDATLTPEGHRRSANGRMLLERTPLLQQAATTVLCVSDFIREQLLQQDWPEEKLRTAPLGVDLSGILPGLAAGERNGVLYVGRLVEKKGANYLLQAMARLPGALRRTKVKLVGDGPLRNELEAMARDLDVNADFLGAQPREVGLRLMGEAQVLALTSIRASDGDAEGLPIVTMEAQARATPLVMFDVGSARHALADGRSGLLARDRDIGDLAAKLETLLADRDLAGRMGAAGLAVVQERFNLERNAAALEAIYDEVAGVRSPEI